jgi:hypothetical protein
VRRIFPTFRDSFGLVAAMIAETFFLAEELHVYGVLFFQDH